MQSFTLVPDVIDPWRLHLGGNAHMTLFCALLCQVLLGPWVDIVWKSGGIQETIVVRFQGGTTTRKLARKAAAQKQRAQHTPQKNRSKKPRRASKDTPVEGNLQWAVEPVEQGFMHHGLRLNWRTTGTGPTTTARVRALFQYTETVFTGSTHGILGAYIMLMYTAIAGSQVDALTRVTHALIALGRQGVPPAFTIGVQTLRTRYIDPHNEGMFIFIEDLREGVDKVLTVWQGCKQ